ncbi:MAG: hypothetical protein WDW38_007631 [Sanguina aurantia]
MAAERKLKNEIDRTLKKVIEGQEVFDDLWKQVHELDNNNQREKLEGELKKEIKKLQRLREQVKSWIQTSDIKDKQPLLDCRKSIEKDMERFKACEKESKMKGFGSNAHNKMDPQERAKEDAREWITNVVESLGAKAEQVNEEMEELQGNVKKGKKPPARYTELEELLGRHKDHLARLDRVLRCLDNDTIAPEELDELKEGMEAYLGGDEDESGIDLTNVDEMYATVTSRLEVIDNAVVSSHPRVSKGKEKEEAEREKEREKDKERERAAAMAAKAQLIAQGNITLKLQQQMQDEEAAERRAITGAGAATVGVAAGRRRSGGGSRRCSCGSTGAPPPPPPPHEPSLPHPSAPSAAPALVRGPSQPFPNNLAPPSTQIHPPPGQPNFNLTAATGQQQQQMQQQQGRAAPPAAAAAAAPPAFGAGPPLASWLTTAAGAATNPASDSSAFPQLGGGAYNPSTPAAESAAPSAKGFIQKLQAGGAQQAPATAAQQQALQQQQQRDSAMLQNRQRHEAEEEQQRQQRGIQQAAAAAQQQLLAAAAAKQSGAQALPGGGLRGPSGPLPGALPPTGRQESFDSVSSSASQVLLTAAAIAAQDKKQQQAEQQQQQQGAAVHTLVQQHQAAAAAEAHKKELEATRELLLRAAAMSAGPELVLPVMTAVYPHHTAQQVLDSCYAIAFSLPPPPSPLHSRARPQLPDTEWKRHKARNPSATPPSFPRAPPDVVDNPALFRKMDPECLFFAFYFQPGSYQQFLAAHELKRQSWRFHKHHNAWFQRFTEPSVTSDEFEEGAYVYFDYNIVHDDLQAGWCYRRKERFTFRYDALEDELRVQPQAS